jgi:Predicted membrane protein
MSLLDLIIIAVGLSMDAFAVSICKGLALNKVRPRHMLIVGLYFGLFQAVMPIIGYFTAGLFAEYVAQYDHWIAMVLLTIIGARMIKESFDTECCTNESPDIALKFGTMLMLSVATSIDALVIGTSFALLSVNIFYAALFIGVTTFLLSAAGVKIGEIFGTRFKAKAEFAGGAILILIGAKILLEHLGVISF